MFNGNQCPNVRSCYEPKCKDTRYEVRESQGQLGLLGMVFLGRFLKMEEKGSLVIRTTVATLDPETQHQCVVTGKL